MLTALKGAFGGSTPAKAQKVQVARGEWTKKDYCYLGTVGTLFLALFICGVLCTKGILPFGAGGALCFFTSSVILFTALMVKSAQINITNNVEKMIYGSKYFTKIDS